MSNIYRNIKKKKISLIVPYVKISCPSKQKVKFNIIYAKRKRVYKTCENQ